MLTPNQEAWLQALESDEFTKTKGALERKGSFCCLGVGCIVAERHGVRVQRHSEEQLSLYGMKENPLIGGNLDHQSEVRKWLGLRTSTGDEYLGTAPTGTALTAMNDKGMTFKEIAQIIRANPEAYFNADTEPGSVAQGS
jgi:hypothetical protein